MAPSGAGKRYPCELSNGSPEGAWKRGRSTSTSDRRLCSRPTACGAGCADRGGEDRHGCCSARRWQSTGCRPTRRPASGIRHTCCRCADRPRCRTESSRPRSASAGSSGRPSRWSRDVPTRPVKPASSSTADRAASRFLSACAAMTHSGSTRAIAAGSHRGGHVSSRGHHSPHGVEGGWSCQPMHD